MLFFFGSIPLARETDLFPKSEQFMVRMPLGLRAKIAALASANGRSMNSEVVAALENHLGSSDRLTEISDFVEDHRDNITALSELYNKVEKLERMLLDHDQQLDPMKYDRD
jgi:hypothetical protein